jgi:hypothetical protein
LTTSIGEEPGTNMTPEYEGATELTVSALWPTLLNVMVWEGLVLLTT